MHDGPEVTYCPIPARLETFEPCDLRELSPLLELLATNRPVAGPAKMPRGTLLPDGRLDLCKQCIGPAGAKAVAEALANHPHVSAVLMGADGIGDGGAEAVAALAASNRGVHTAYLGCNRIGPDGIASLAGAIERGADIHGLWLKRNPVGDAGAVRLAEMLSRTQKVGTLDLVNTEIGPAGLAALADALAHRNRSVRRLYLGGNGIGPEGAAVLGDVLRTNPNLTALMLNASHLADDGCLALANALRENQTLVELGLASNGVGPRGAGALFEAAVVHPALRVLDLGYCASSPTVDASANTIGDEGAAVAVACLANDPVLTHLDLTRNGITSSGVTRIVDALERNHHLLKLSIGGVVLPAEVIGRLKACLTRNGKRVPSHQPDEDVLAVRSVYRPRRSGSRRDVV